jgi:hypothetical protein
MDAIDVDPFLRSSRYESSVSNHKSLQNNETQIRPRCKKRKHARNPHCTNSNNPTKNLSPFPQFDPNPPKFLIPDCTWIAPIHRINPKSSQIKHSGFRLNARPISSQLSKVQNKILRLPPHPISLDLHYAPKNVRSTADECQCRSLRLPNLIGHQQQDN